MFVTGHYTDIHSILGGRVGGGREVQSIIDDDGHYSDIRTGRGSVRGRTSGYEHYVDIDRVNRDQPAGGNQAGAARSRGYEGLDPSALATLLQPQRPHEYAGLAAGEAAASTEEIEMNSGNYQNSVSQ